MTRVDEPLARGLARGAYRRGVRIEALAPWAKLRRKVGATMKAAVRTLEPEPDDELVASWLTGKGKRSNTSSARRCPMGATVASR
jgi:hypothetical protein